jgi:hypothetical protein
VETGLYYNRFRYYDSNTGSYISQDPIGLAGNNPNFYAYTFDSNTEVDPFGLSRSECGMDKMPDPYKGVKEASNMMKELRLPRNIRKQVLQSFEVKI